MSEISITKSLLTLCLTFIFGGVFGQESRNEIGFVTENDLYTSSVYDRYYTNGLEIYFIKPISARKAEKRLLGFRAGQYLYNPQTRDADNLLVNDRPFCGLLFGEASIFRYYKSENYFRTEVQLGYIGPNSFGEEMQETFHNLSNFKTVRGWQNQIHNAFLAQFNATHYLALPWVSNSKFSFGWQNKIQLGTILTGVTSGFNARIAIHKLLPIYESNLYQASAGKQTQPKPRELYFFLNPNFNYQFYDATIQGSLFSDSSPVTFDLIPIRFVFEAGFKYRYNRFNAHYTFNYRSQEVDNNVNMAYFYGSIKLGYLF